MPEYVVLCCFSCGTFQSHQKRKDAKFTCVICHEKQSHRKLYAISDRAQDMRKVVQQLNMQRGVAEEKRCATGQLLFFH
jgi:hypothetical protein